MKALHAPNLDSDIINSYLKIITDEYGKKLECYLQENLKSLGYSFSDRDEFLIFCAKRMTRKVFGLVSDLYIQEDGEDVFVGRFSTETSFDVDLLTSRVTTTIG